MRQMLAMGDQALMQMAGEQRDALRPRVMPEEVAGHADLAAAAGAEHRLIQPGPVLDLLLAGRLQAGERDRHHGLLRCARADGAGGAEGDRAAGGAECCARYRSGDGSGVALVTPSTSCETDSAQALWIAIRQLRRDGLQTVMSALDRERLRELGMAFEHLLEPFGLERADWDRNADSALAAETGSGGHPSQADPFLASQSLHDALLSWRSLLPRSAHDRFTAEFLRAGLPVLTLRTNQIPGADSQLEPKAPTALFGTLPGATLILGRLGDGLFPLWNPTGQLAGLVIALAYSGVAVVLALRSGLWRRQTRWPSPRRLFPRAGRWLLPDFSEELIFRGVLLPSALDGVQPLALLPWMALSVGLFVAWHRLAGWSVLNCRVRPGFQDPRVLVQTALLGGGGHQP